ATTTDANTTTKVTTESTATEATATEVTTEATATSPTTDRDTVGKAAVDKNAVDKERIARGGVDAKPGEKTDRADRGTISTREHHDDDTKPSKPDTEAATAAGTAESRVAAG
ncbi:MAG TPA: hypothetical protein VHJ79_21250, partial [Mycobacterium sp.]|nr:hypothetical protein [Mycobacterium sp.]